MARILVLFLAVVLMVVALNMYMNDTEVVVQPLAQEDLVASVEENIADDADVRFKSLYGREINTLEQGLWEYQGKDGSSAYVSYISPYVEQGNKIVYMVLEYEVDSTGDYHFVTYKFFNQGEDYKDNHR